MEEGSKLGPYEVQNKLGAGGMGEVYLAEDTRLGRKVAIKVLPAQFAGDPERLARFEQESRAAAALNHPGIAAIYDVGVEGEGEDRTHYMVQEFLEGETLQDFLERGAIPRKKALTIASEIAAALAVAHEAGIIHRDLKPANVFVTPTGNAKVLDFGLAKLTEMSAVSASGDNSMSPTVVGTMAGTIMGTAGYMAPEQVHGEGVDRRADIFALGCVLYELLGGTRAFTGKSLPDTLAKILHEAPEPLTGLGPALERLMEKCLAKEPAERYQHADDLALDLRYLASNDEPVTAAAAAGGDDRPGVSWAMAAGIGALALVAGALGNSWLGGDGGGRSGSSGSAALAEFPTQITEFSTGIEDPAVSPNGQMVAFIAEDPTDGWAQLYVKTLPDGPPLRLTNTPDHKGSPAFSPDGSRIAYTVVGEDWKWDTWSVPISGGEPRLMLRNGNALQWTQDGRVVFSQFKEGAHLGIVRADVSGANQEEIWFPPRGYQMAHYSDVSPDGDLVAVGFMGATEGDNRQCFISALPVADGEPPPIGDGPGCRMRIRFSPDGEWVYYAGNRGAEVWRSPVGGGPAELIVPEYPGMEDMSGFALTPDGRSLIYSAGTSRRNVWLRRADGSSAQITFEHDSFDPAFSADGRYVFYRQRDRGRSALWRYSLANGNREAVCQGLNASGFVLSPDGNRVLVMEPRGDSAQVMVCYLDGSQPPRVLFDGLNPFGAPPVFSPDGEYLYLGAGDESGQRTLSRVALATGEMSTLRTVDQPASVMSVSPDGRWLSVNLGFAVSNGWLFPVEGDEEPRRIVDGWDFVWSPGGESFLFINGGMVSSAWELANPDDLLVPEGLPERVDTDWLREAGAVRLLSTLGFSRASPSPRLFEAVYDANETRGNLFQITLPE